MSAPGLRQAALTGARWTLMARFGLQLLTWPATILVVRWLDSADYGLFAIALLVTGFISIFGELGLGVALVQARTLGSNTARMASSLILGLNGLFALVIVLLAPWVASALDKPEAVSVMRVLTIDLLLISIASVPYALLERDLKFRQLSLAQLVAGGIGALTTVTCAWHGFGVWALVIGTLSNSLVRTGMLIVFHGRPVWPGWIDRHEVREFAHFSAHVLASRLLWYWYGQADQLVLARQLVTALLGYYVVAVQMAMLPAGKAMEAINRVAFPILSKGRADAQWLGRLHQQLIGLLALYGFGACWGLAAVSQEFVAVILGAKWQAIALPLTVLSLIAPLRMLCSLHNTITTAVGSPQTTTWELLVSGVVLPLAIALGAWWDGVFGASMAWLLAFPPIYLFSNALTCRVIHCRPWAGLRPVCLPLVAGVAMLLAVWLTRASMPDANLVVLLLVEIIVGATVYLAVLWLLARPLLREARALVLELIRSRPSNPAS